MLCRSGILVKTAPSSDQKASPFPYPWTPGAIDRSLMHKNAVSAVVPRDPGFLDVFIQGRQLQVILNASDVREALKINIDNHQHHEEDGRELFDIQCSNDENG